MCLHGLNNLFPCSKIFNSKRGLRASRPIFNFLQRIIRSKNWFIKLRIFYRCLFLVRNSGPSCSQLRCLITAANLSAKIPDCISLQVFRTTKHICINSPASSPALQQHIMSKNSWNNWIFHFIHEEVQAKTISTLKYIQKLFISNWVHNLLLACQHMKSMGQAKQDLCLSCLKTIKISPHIFTSV